jgi:large subunit ribosomal protein L21
MLASSVRRFSLGGEEVYAIIRTGGKQYRVEQGDTLRLEKLEAPVGETISLGEVLLLGGDGSTQVGSPLVKALVVARVVEHGRSEKVRIFKYKKRKHYRRTKGHRQSYTAVRIEAIET